MRISARNQIPGTVATIVKGATTAHVGVRISGGQVITASITNQAVEDLNLTVGQAAVVVIKASDVMVGVD